MATAAHTDLSRTAHLFHALSDEARLAVLDILGDREHCVCDLTAALDIAQSRLSFHLKVLKDAGLISDRREGRWVYYTLCREPFDEALESLTSMRPRKRSLHVAGACCA
jgi:ArsR family transcriptional regulator, arsenate/arsenite/antimonite-responsive transcriptional repressor